MNNNNNYCKAVSLMDWELPISEMNWLKLILKAIYCRFSHLDWYLARLHFAVKKDAKQNTNYWLFSFNNIYLLCMCQKARWKKNKEDKQTLALRKKCQSTSFPGSLILPPRSPQAVRWETLVTRLNVSLLMN